jgi:hypothetical protein
VKVAGQLGVSSETVLRWTRTGSCRVSGCPAAPCDTARLIWPLGSLSGLHRSRKDRAAGRAPHDRAAAVVRGKDRLRPEEWQALERRDVDRRAGVLNVRRTVSSSEVVELGKTNRSRRQVPLSPRALGAMDSLPPRLDTPLLFPAPGIGVLNLNNFRSRVWAPAIEASGIRKPARIYDLRSTFASYALVAEKYGVRAHARHGSVEMIERHYGALLDGSGASMASAWQCSRPSRIGPRTGPGPTPSSAFGAIIGPRRRRPSPRIAPART